MKILKLKLRGAIGIRKGLGVEEVEIDFTNFQSGLIALTGRNGSGKTTIMENLHPYRMMVSRDGSLQNHFYLKDSYRILHFVQNDKEYESKILIDALTGGSEAYLICNGKPLNDGKLTTYDEEIEKVLGSSDLFFNSVFSGQKSKGVAELKPADRRKLFYELLNLDIYEQYLEKAKAELKSFELKLSSIEGEISALQNNQPALDDLLKEKEDLVKNEEKLVEEITKTEKEIEFINSEIKRIEVNIRLDEQKLKDNEEAQDKIALREVEIKNLSESHNSKISRYNSDIIDLNKLVERNNKLLQNKDTINNSLKKIERKEFEISDLTEFKSKLNEEFSVYQEGYNKEVVKLNQLGDSLYDSRMKFKMLEGSFTEKKNKLEQVNSDAKLIDEVPCTKEVGSGCKFLINAYSGKDQINTLVAALNGLSNQLESQKTALQKEEEYFNQEKKTLDDNYSKTTSGYKSSLLSIENHITGTEKELKELKSSNWKKMLDEANEADSNNKVLQEKISSTNILIDEAKKSFDNELHRIMNDISTLTEKIDNEIDLKLRSAKNELSEKNDELKQTNQSLKTSRDLLESINRQLATIDQQIETLKGNNSKIEKLQDSKIKVEREIREWSFLCKAFDKTGIPVLKLENSGIQITSVANELLSIFENKFRIVFETTKLKADKKNFKESFDINIIEDDGVCEISNKSGGQQVWLETAIQLAISLVVRNQGRNIETAFLDEKDGALDLENAYSYIEMLRRAHTMSGVHNTFIITHRPELLDFIPQQVRLRDGVLEVMN